MSNIPTAVTVTGDEWQSKTHQVLDQRLYHPREVATSPGLCVPIHSSLLSSQSDLLTSPGAVSLEQEDHVLLL